MTELKKFHILIAEDDSDDAEIIQESFEKNTFFSKVDIVKNGQELIDFLSSCNGNLPQVILTDINMPIMNGIEAMAKIHANPELGDIACFVYSTTIDPVYKARCIKYGTKGFIIKPFSLQDFNEIPAKILAILNQEYSD